MAKAKRAATPDSRREPLLDAAAELFASKGYAGTSTRDIAKAVGMLPGSIYYHFRSKEEILLAVYHEGVSRFTAALEVALETTSDPWEQLERACVTHVSILLDSGPYARIIAPEFIRSFPPEIRKELVAERDRYEKGFEKLIGALPLKPDVDPWLLKAALFGSLNWTPTWYHSGRYDAATIAKSFLRFFSSVLDDPKNVQG
jgi:AcrR family transcriptional regulator